MSNVLVVVEHLDGELKKVNRSCVSFAKETAEVTGGEVYLLVLGSGVEKVAKEAATIEGVDKVLLGDSPAFAHYLAETYRPAVVKAVEDNEVTVVVAAASTFGKDLLPGVAAKLDAGMVSDAIAVWEDDDGDLLYKRPLWAGNVITTIQVSTPIHVVTVRTSEFEAAADGGDADVETVDFGVDAPSNVEFVSFEQVKSERPELTDASVIISGGRGLKSAENFQIVMDLADSLKGAVGATRAAVDSGYAPNDWQIGQTGKIVAPNLYVAVAISGAIQHLAGMKGSKTIVAINTDPEAPIFQVADYGLVEDAFTAIPKLTEEIKNA